MKIIAIKSLPRW